MANAGNETRSADIQALRRAYYDRLSQKDMAPLWEVLKDLVPPAPVTPYIPAIWRFGDFKPMVMEAGGLITAKEAERRVLVLENPGARGRSCITQSLYAGIQMILPGEIAPRHRHTSGAIRFILDGEGAYTQVDGEKALMSRGDFVITPSWSAHDHGNDSCKPMLRLDVLDAPTVNFFGAAFMEHLGDEMQNTHRSSGDSMSRFGSGVLPNGTDTSSLQSPIVNYPYATIRPVLERLERAGEIHPQHGASVRYSNPFNGGWVTPTMGAHLSRLPEGFKGQNYRSTDGAVFACIEGHGRTRLEKSVLEWKKGDVFVIPTWHSHSHETDDGAVLFGISDRPAQESLGIWRENN